MIVVTDEQGFYIINPFSTVTYLFINDSEIDTTILLILVRVYEGYKIKKDILHLYPSYKFFESV